MRYAAVAVLLATAGCRQILGIETRENDAGDAGCFGAGDFRICPGAVGTRDLTFGAQALSSDDDCMYTLSQPQGPAWCIVVGRSITVTGHVQVSGSQPLVLVAREFVEIKGAGMLDVASKAMGKAGPGSLGEPCIAPPPGTVGSPGSSGGAGGSHGTPGGRGGTGAAESAMPRPGPMATPLDAPPIALVGGCAGSVGGGTSDPAGKGGGALYLLAGQDLIVTGVLNASGAGGGGGRNTGGGSGGGSGGTILLSAPTVQLDASSNILANGGGGGGGSAAGTTGEVGGESTFATSAASGGRGINGGTGGIGGYATSAGAQGIMSAAGGGGGGGGAGRLAIHTDELIRYGVTQSPPPTTTF